MATQKDIALNIKVKFEGANTVQELEDVLSDINKELDDVEQGSEAFEILTDTATKATKEVKEVNTKVKDLNGQSATLKNGMQGLSGVTQIFGGAVGDLFGKLQGATDQMGKLSTAFKSSSSGISGSSKALRVFKIALAATGVGLLIIALGSLVAYFTKTQRGADKVSQALAGLKAGIAVIVDRFSSLGEGLLALFRGDFAEAGTIFKKAVSGIADEMSREAKEAASLEVRLQKLELREIALIETQSRRRSEIEKLKLLAQENFEDSQKAAAFTQKAINLEMLQAKEQIAIAKERASIIKTNIGLGESMNDDLRESAEANARVIELEGERDSKLKELTSQLRGFQNAQKGANDETKEAVKIQEAIAAPNGVTTEEQLKRQLKQYEDYALARAKITIDTLQSEEDAKQRSLASEKEINDAKKDLAISMYTNLTNAASMFFANTEEGQRKAFEFNKAVQIADTIISTIAAAQNAFLQGSKFSLAAGYINAALATAAGLARVEAIRRTQFNSPSADTSAVGGGGSTLPSQTQNTSPVVPIVNVGENGQLIKVYVTETDIRNSTRNVNSIYQKAIVTE